jgi:small subunit ribosomal protein S6
MKDSLFRRYTAIIAYSPSIGKEKVDSEIDKFKQLVVDISGKVEKAEYLGLKPLAYEIKKYNTAHYVQFYFKFEDNKHLKHNLSELTRKASAVINQNILRQMIIKLENQEFNFESLRNFHGFENNIKV